MKIAFHTLGCKVNQFDTAVMENLTREADHKIVPFDRFADVYVINTCSVTANADQDSRRLVRQIKRRNPSSRIIMTGCYAQTHPEELVRIQGVNLILGNREKQDLAAYLGGCERSEGPVLSIDRPISDGPLIQPVLRQFTGHTRFFLKIQDGCDYRCTFCLIPRARGPGRSLLPEKVIEQTEALVEEGCQELVLTGVNLGTYGRDFKPKQSLAKLLRLLLDRTRIARIRLSSLEPKTVTPELVEAVESSPRICRHFHVPLQSGDNRILKKMNRHYSRRYYRQLILSLAERFPGASIGADVMVGFPDEGETEYRNTYRLLEELPMSYIHVFPFSSRPETPAALMPVTISESEKKDRAEELRRLSEEKSRQFSRFHLGRELSALIEKARDSETGLLKGLSDNYIKVLLPGPDALMNRIRRIRVTAVDEKRVTARLS
ncbi:MAG TPA: tRNA (N(6)-L-threonylcarbamoyladenosine(37)-C(2))-methylthiotransferase MtaB [Nitrospiria bacterium]|nr:tRNA (N(6)-L-threonylcarbamoyladenosine(37)-C(2))-methylthiotransferase MtaB [Nitrospiria bacterium]